MRWLMLLFIPALCWAQEFTFRQEFDTIPVEIDGWRPYQPWVGGFSISAPAICDINGDGLKDLFIGDFLGYLSYFKGVDTLGNYALKLVTSLFDSISVFGPPWGGSSHPCFGDLDFDGDLDLIVGDANSYTHYYRNIGNSQNPEFQLITDTLVYQGPPWVCRPQLTDIDADGDYDLFGSSWGQVSFYRNIGTPQTYNFSLVTGSFLGINVGDKASPEFVDLDADGDLDLFIGSENGKIWHYRNDGSAQQYSFTYVTNNYAGIDAGGYASPEFADLDGDGDCDLLVGRENESLYYPGDIFYYENTGSPFMAQWILRTPNFLSLDEGDRAKNCSTDIDADNDPDLFLMHQGYRLSHFENVGDSTHPSFEYITGTFQNLTANNHEGAPFFADIDNDQDPDLFIGEGILPNPPYPGLYLYENVGTPQNALYRLVSNNLVPYPFHVAIRPSLADINADGDKDLFIKDNNYVFYFFENIGSPDTPRFANPVINWQNLSGAGKYFTFYDIDGDGDLDYFCTMGNWVNDDFLGFYRNTGTPQEPNLVFQTNSFLTPEGGKFLQDGIDIIDIDGDGDGDFFMGTSDGGMLFFRNTTGDTTVVGPKHRPRPQRQLSFALSPQPGNTTATITFALASPQEIDLAVYNLLGARVATLASGKLEAGNYSLPWDSRGKASGIYLVRLATPAETLTRKLTIIK